MKEAFYMIALNINFLSNNVKGLQSCKKRAKLFEYFKSKLAPNGILFAQETHSSRDIETKWKNEFSGQLFYSHGKTNSCGVLTGFYGNKTFKLVKEMSDKNGRILILDVIIDDSEFLLINLYNANTELEQLKTLAELERLLVNFDIDSDKKIIFSGDFNIFFDSALESSGGNPKYKNKSVSKVIEIIETYDLCDIWRIKNPKLKRYTFRQKHFSGIIQRRLDYIFISRSLQEYTKPKILNSLSTDHSLIFCSIYNIGNYAYGPGLWKFNNSLLLNEDYTKKVKEHIRKTLIEMKSAAKLTDQMMWEYLKFKIRTFTITFAKKLAREKREIQNTLEKEVRELEKNLKNNEDLDRYEKCKNKLEQFYDQKVKGIRLSSK